MFIAIEGNIGAGKTTLAQALAKKLKANYLPEEFEENTLLPLFYKDHKTFAFPTEYSFLIDRQKQLVKYFSAVGSKKITVSDFHFDKCLCFARANLTKKDFSFFKKHFLAIQKTVKTPDLVVYLDANPELLMKNIKKRGRKIEKDLKQKYLIKLQKSLDNYYISDGKINTLVLILTVNKYTDHTMENCCKEILEIIDLKPH